jgi:hypothetical protein
MAKPNPAAPTTEKETRYVLTRARLQNDFFLNPERRIANGGSSANRQDANGDSEPALAAAGPPQPTTTKAS